MSEVEEYMKKANDKLISAKALYDIGQYATSVSASYYCMFITAKALLIKKGHSPKSHEGMISQFGKLYVKEGNFDKDIAKYLSRGQSLREDADYDAYDGITENIAKLWVNNAEKFMNEGKKFL